MADDNKSGNGKSDQNAKAGDKSNKTQQQQGSKSSGQMKQDDDASRGKQGGSHEQHVKAGKQSHKND